MTPSHLLGLEVGSLEALTLDVALADRLAEESEDVEEGDGDLASPSQPLADLRHWLPNK